MSTLEMGAQGPAVATLQRELNHALGPGRHIAVDGDFGPVTRAAVEEFQREHGLTVDGIVGPETRAALCTPQPVEPRFRTPGAHIEVDTIRQLVLVVRDGAVKTVVNTSTAGIPGYHTPHGTFHVFRRVRGIDTSPLGKLYDPLAFYRGYAIHGSTNVPPHPASHGCVRVPMWVAPHLYATIPYGQTVYVY